MAGKSKIIALPAQLKNARLKNARLKTARRITSFSREEFRFLLRLYSLYVMAGLWRDYAMSQTQDGAFFAVYRHSFDAPLYRIIKRREARGRTMLLVEQGAHTLLKRGADRQGLDDIFTLFHSLCPPRLSLLRI